jgi:hypothetical protein
MHERTRTHGFPIFWFPRKSSAKKDATHKCSIAIKSLKLLIDYLLFYVSLKIFFTLMHDVHEDVTITGESVTIIGEGLRDLGLCSVLRTFEQGGIFIVPHLL